MLGWQGQPGLQVQGTDEGAKFGGNGSEVRRGMTSPGSLGWHAPARDRHGVV